jgi:hypothetical protein
MISLLAISTGILDDMTPIAIQSVVHSGTNALVIFGLLHVLVERKIDKDSPAVVRFKFIDQGN